LVPLSDFTGSLKLSIYAAVPVLIAGLVFLYYGFKLFKNKSENTAKKLMAVSIIYLMSMQIIYVLDKFI
jgi:protoheme IX farnesyltransferase